MNVETKAQRQNAAVARRKAVRGWFARVAKRRAARQSARITRAHLATEARWQRTVEKAAERFVSTRLPRLLKKQFGTGTIVSAETVRRQVGTQELTGLVDIEGTKLRYRATIGLYYKDILRNDSEQVRYDVAFSLEAPSDARHGQYVASAADLVRLRATAPVTS